MSEISRSYQSTWECDACETQVTHPSLDYPKDWRNIMISEWKHRLSDKGDCLSKRLIVCDNCFKKFSDTVVEKSLLQILLGVFK